MSSTRRTSTRDPWEPTRQFFAALNELREGGSMEQLSAVRSVLGSAFIADRSDPEDYWLEGEPVEVQVERTDNDEIRIGLHVGGNQAESAGVYLSRSEAIRIVLAIAQAVGDR